MIVLDTSVFVDAIIPFNRERHRKSTTVLDVISEKELEVNYNSVNTVADDINENSATLAIYKDAKLVYLERIETGPGRIVIAYAEKRRRIMRVATEAIGLQGKAQEAN